jgi:hypothetical protein
MTDVSTEQKGDEIATTGLLEHLRERFDVLKLRLELAKLDARDIERQQLDIAQNAYLASYAKVPEMARDVTATFSALADGVEKLVHDVQLAIEAAEAAIARG